MSKPNRKLRVGVTIHIRDGNQSIWENGIFQNCVFLVQLFNLSPEVEKAVLVNGSGAKEVHPSMMFDQVGVEMIDLPAALETLDVVIEMSSQVPEDWLVKFREKGGRIAWMRCGNDFVIDIERAMYNKPHAGLCSAKKYDAVWTLPEYEKSCTDYFALTTRAPVRIVPHLWAPAFFQKGIDTLPQGVRFGYQPGSKRWRVCSFEPNVCMVKTSVTPMLVCEEAYRKYPKFLEYFRVCNTLHLKEKPALVRFATSLDIVKHGVTTFEGRFAIYEYMAHFGDCIISHHWENGQNYLYYEALYGGYPLIHNSEFIRELGYFYPDFDCQAGGEALVRAFETHDANLEEYKARSAEFLKTLDIRYRVNIEAYTAELLALYKITNIEKVEINTDSALASGQNENYYLNNESSPPLPVIGKPIPQNLGHMVREGHLGGFFSEGDGGTYYPLMWSELVRRHSIKSVLDIGCGRGYSALYFKSLGCTIKGVDGSAEAAKSNLIGENFEGVDYSLGSSNLSGFYDLVWSCEFVEHVEERFMQNYLEDFRRGRYLAMTFAGPGQPGHHHVNCRPAEYWIRIMHSQGFDYLPEETTELRELVKEDMEKNNRESEKRFVYHFIDRGLFFRNSAFF